MAIVFNCICVAFVKLVLQKGVLLYETKQKQELKQTSCGNLCLQTLRRKPNVVHFKIQNIRKLLGQYDTETLIVKE